MKDRVLITGASGFVGYHLVEEALRNNLEVYAAIRKSSQIDHLKSFNINYVYPDFTDKAALTKVMDDNRINYIIHAAGATKARSQAEYEQINATYTQNLALAALDAKVELKKFVFLSSLAAIGPLTSADGVITEKNAPHPVTAYGRSKLLAEQQLVKLNKLNYIILRPTAVYGPRDKDIFIFFQQVVRGIEPYIGKAAQKLSFIYVTDLAKASVKALYSAERKAYNLSDGNFYSKYALGDITKNVLNLKAYKFHLPVNFVKVIAAIAEKVSSLSNKASALNIEKLNELTAANWNCDIEEAKREMGFSPVYNLEAGLTETLNWYKANKWL